jgi:Flp pilus assembly protein TadG
MGMLAKLRAFRRDRRGVTAVEFGFIALPMSLMILPPIDLGYRVYGQSVLQGVLVRAARLSTTGNYSNSQIDAVVHNELAEFKNNATVTITRQSYQKFGGVGASEKITSDTAPVGSYNVGDCYDDTNGNGSWDADQGRAGQGGAEDVVLYQVTLTFPRIIPMTGLLGFPSNETLKSSIIIKNQPYAAATQYPIVNRCT